MKAVVQDGYGSADVLHLREIEMPVLSDDRVLVRVRAASVNALDWHTVHGGRLVRAVGLLLRQPASPIRGADVAGQVETVGRNVTRLRPRDEVFGTARGTFAEFANAREDRLVAKPPQLSFAQAGAMGVAGVTALQGLRDRGGVKPGQRVLIHGAGGGVGTFAVQIAKALGAHVTAVTSTRNLELVRSVVLGTTVTITHTVGVYGLGALTLVAAQYVLPERLYPILGVLSGVLVIAIGLGLLRARIRPLRGRADHRDELVHSHGHGDGPGQHRHDGPVGMRGLVALGVSGGLLLCPAALVVLLAAVSVHNVLLGMVLVAAFSVGLAIVLTGIGLAFVFGQRALRRRHLLSRVGGSAIARALPTLSAAAITVAGVIIAIGAARGLA